jgi:protein-S-isoprenylcysteine O-methyltransferase Ste14
MPETGARPKSVKRRAVAQTLAQLILMSLPFVAAGTVHWTRGWIWIGLSLFSLAVFLGVVRAKNPGLLRTRLGTKAPSKPFDKLFVALFIPSLLAFNVTAGLNARWGWSHLPFAWVYAGIALHLTAVVLLSAVAATNPFLEGTVRIQSEHGHFVVTSGPYAIVRHPMYAAMVVMYMAWPLVLGSLWAYIPVACVAILLVFRTANEDRTLLRELPGYEDYARRTRYRLIPGLW